MKGDEGAGDRVEVSPGIGQESPRLAPLRDSGVEARKSKPVLRKEEVQGIQIQRLLEIVRRLFP